MAEAKAQESATFGDVETLPPDAIFFTKQAYQQDPDKRKVNLGIGAYRDDAGKPYVLKIVRKVEKELADDMKLNKEYLPIGGDAEYVELTQKLILGDCARVKNKAVTGVQAISGTGALRVLFCFIKNVFAVKNDKIKILISNPTWGNHKKVIQKAGLQFDSYTYWDAKGRCLNLDAMINDLKTKGNKGDVVLLHGCAHNPTGVDPTKEQWEKIAETIKAAGLVPFFDCAYQGFATGDLEADAAGVRLFEEKGFEFLIAQSYAKNLGLYCERAGCASVVTTSPAAAKACKTQLEGIVRPMYSNPPAHGARIVKKVLGDAENFKAWKAEMAEMSGRIIEMRKRLRAKLEELKTPGTWNHITDQIGMFTFTGLTEKQVDVMTTKYHIYLLKNGRISMAGVAS
eukprot:CAMPEP_0197044724 /NCGR_PEP_ID=MMETSP1384-20130603/20719_1 /TAXON_ID=29189 /ORGANISM="Ammonia sp." /LENGTH=398 /DNA_ID=CAMNT_0042476231 /DNA_START=74 /DNA_END=1267 /DNA_ORIENTATION=-